MVKTSLISRLSEIFEEKSKMQRLSRFASLYEDKCIKKAQADPFSFLDNSENTQTATQQADSESVDPQEDDDPFILDLVNPSTENTKDAPVKDFPIPELAGDDDPFSFLFNNDEENKDVSVKDFPIPELAGDDDLFSFLSTKDEESKVEQEPNDTSVKDISISEMENQLKKFISLEDYRAILNKETGNRGSKNNAIKYIYDNYLSYYKDISEITTDFDSDTENFELSLDNYNEGSDNEEVITSDDAYDLQQGVQEVFNEGSEMGSEKFIPGTTVTRSRYDKQNYDRLRSMIKRNAISPIAFFNTLQSLHGENANYYNLSEDEKMEILKKVTSPDEQLSDEQKEKWISQREMDREVSKTNQRAYDKKSDKKRRNTATEEGKAANNWKNASQRAKKKIANLYGISHEEAVERFNKEIERRVAAGEDKVQAARAMYNELISQEAVQRLIKKFVTNYMKKHPDAPEEQVRAAVSGKSIEEIKEIMKQNKIR